MPNIIPHETLASHRESFVCGGWARWTPPRSKVAATPSVWDIDSSETMTVNMGHVSAGQHRSPPSEPVWIHEAKGLTRHPGMHGMLKRRSSKEQ